MKEHDMAPGLKTFLKVLLGAVGTAVAAFLVDPSHYVQFGGLATLFVAVGGYLAHLLEKTAA